MSIQLKIKECSLAAESTIIKRQMRRLTRSRARANDPRNTLEVSQQRVTQIDAAMASLQMHRANVVKWAARNTHLARAFLKGQRHLQVETEPKNPELAAERRALMKRSAPKPISDMVRRYGGQKYQNVTPDQIKDWLYV